MLGSGRSRASETKRLDVCAHEPIRCAPPIHDVTRSDPWRERPRDGRGCRHAIRAANSAARAGAGRRSTARASRTRAWRRAFTAPRAVSTETTVTANRGPR
ncbi:hypothetical protein F5D26_34300 [Burkholderia pseudomallei]|nr:hypothetical protein F5D26_34300 [Burkholderia pseudomallei]